MNEQKLTAQIAGMYPDAKIYRKFHDGEYGIYDSFIGVRFKPEQLELEWRKGKFDWFDLDGDQYQLILTRLEDITDEHAVGLFKAYHNGESITIYSKKEKNDAEMAEVSKTELVPKYKIHRIENIQKIIDYLRSHGYDCGYGYIPSLISAGIAVSSLSLK